MNHPNLTLLYVADPQASAAFYTDILGVEPVEKSPTFVMFVLENGLKLGFWARDRVEPVVKDTGSGVEVAVLMDNSEQVDDLHAAWAARGLDVAQAPTDMDFGHTFVVRDPDGHRVRVYALSAQG